MLTTSQKSLIKEIVNTSNDYENDLNIFYEDTSFRGVEAEASDYYNDCVQRIFEQQMDEERLDEKSLFGSLDSQTKKIKKAAEKFKQAAEDANSRLQKFIEDVEKAENSNDLSLLTINQLRDSNGKVDIKRCEKVADALDATWVVVGLSTNIKETENILKTLEDPEFVKICKKIDDNTGWFGRDKGKFNLVDPNGGDYGKGSSKGLTSKSVKKDVMKGKNLGEARLYEKDTESIDQDTFNKVFAEPAQKLAGSIANINNMEKLLKDDPTVQKLLKRQGIDAGKLLGFATIAGIVLRIIGGFIPGMPLIADIGQAIASGAVAGKGANNIVKTVKNKNIPLGKKVLLIGGSAALVVIGALGFKQACSNIINDMNLHGELEGTDVSQALGDDSEGTASSEGEEPTHASSNTIASEEMRKGKAAAAAAAKTNTSNTGDDVPLKGVEKNFVAGSNPDQLTDEKPTIANSIEAQANAKPGDVIERADGTKWKLTKGDIDWAKSQIKEEPDIGEAPADDPDLENPLFDKGHIGNKYGMGGAPREAHEFAQRTGQFTNDSSGELDGGKYQDFNFSDLGKDGRKQFFDFVSKEEYIDKARSNVMVLEDGTKIQVDPYVDDNDNPLYHIGVTPDGHGVIYDMKGRVHDLGEIGKKDIKLPKETQTPWIKYFDEDGNGKLDSSVTDAFRKLKNYDTEENGFIKCDAEWFEDKLGVSMPEEETSTLDFGYKTI